MDSKTEAVIEGEAAEVAVVAEEQEENREKSSRARFMVTDDF